METFKKRDRSGGIVTRLWDGRPNSISGSSRQFYFCPPGPDWLWGLPSLLSNE